MTKDEFLNIAEKQFEKTLELLKSKGNDYSNADALSNFKTVAAITGVSPEIVALVLTGVKVARLGVLLNGTSPKNESIADSVDDLRTYTFLLGGIIEEKYTGKLPVPTDEDVEKNLKFLDSLR
jgi:hypothetical protein